MKPIYRHTRMASLLVAALTALGAAAQAVSYEQALATASDFFVSKGLDAPSASLRRAKAPAAVAQDQSPYYIINHDNAFAVVAADSRVTPILAYSLDGAFDDSDVPDGAAYMLQMYADYIAGLRDGSEEPKPRRTLQLSQGKLLNTATWTQNWEPWNAKCPVYTDENGHRTTCYAGCVAAAMSIVMKYHSWPQTTGYGSKTYITNTHKFECSADFGGTDYKIASLPDTFDGVQYGSDEVKGRIATLLYHAGVAASMDYDPNGSGSADINALKGLCRYFGYTYGARALRSNYDSDDAYLAEIIGEIDQNCPVLYSGQDAAGGGHMFVCDGYDTDGRLHFNFGWGGTRNSYYSIAETSMTYYKSQQALIGLRPNPDAASAEHPALYFADCGDQVTPISISYRYRRTLFLSADRVYNMTEGDIEDMYLRLCICDEAGNIKGSVYDRPVIGADGTPQSPGASVSYNYILSVGGYSYIPADYSYTPGDRIKLFYSEDQGSSWHEVLKYGGMNYLDLALLYDTTLSDLRMYDNNGDCPGLQLAGAGFINASGTPFDVKPGNLWNYTYADFQGDVAIFLCDSDDNPKKMVSSPKAVSLEVSLFTNDVKIACTLQPQDNIKAGDRLVAFCRPTGREDWTMITCDDPGKYYISIPEALIPTSVTVEFDGLFSPYCPALDLDFGSIGSFAAYTVALLDSETLLLQRIDNVPAGEGVLLMGADGAKAYSGTADIMASTPSTPDENLLVGVLEDTVVDNDDATGVNYVFLTSPATGFYQAAGQTVLAGSAYMRISGAPLGAPARFVFAPGAGEAGVFTVTADTVTDTTIYNLQGMKVTKPGRGIYIMGGRKVIIR